MKRSSVALLLVLVITSCRQSSKPIVNIAFADSLISHFQPSEMMLTSDSNLVFWQNRMKAQSENFVNGPKYAGALSSHFHLFGNIKDLRSADSLMQRSNEANQFQEASIFRTLASYAMLQHQFQNADSFLTKAVAIEGHNIPNNYLDFDISFELGYYQKAKNLLNSLRNETSYAYYFRKSKYDHYDGSLDSSISYMMRANDKAANSKYLQQTALSNAADLNIHKGDIQTAYDLYVQSIRIDAGDLHSIMGIGWIALVHDKNDTLAERIFQFVRHQSSAPDALLKLEQVAEARNDTTQQRKYAAEFVAITTDSVYGKMYNKYLIDLYTGILKDPAKAVVLAGQEIHSRPTPQVYAWYAWSLFCNDQKDQAYTVFKDYVSKKPLEGLELYYMGKMMKGLDKGYNAQQFFKVAYKNRYDLSPAKVKELEKDLE